MSKNDDFTNESHDRVMNDSTMPPPRRAAAVPPKSAVGAGQQRGTPNMESKPRIRKVGRFGLADWTRLLSVSKNIAQRKGAPLRKIRMSEIRRHNKVYDGWMVLKGKVYNLSPYLPYHPGGERILQSVLGNDGTVLYNKYHQWVNEDGLIGKLLIGYLDTSRDPNDSEEDDSADDDDKNKNPYIIPTAASNGGSSSSSGFALPVPPKR